MKKQRPNNSAHRVTPQQVTGSHHDTDVSGTRQETELQPPEFSVSTTDKTKFQFVQATPHECTPIAEAPAPSHAVGAAIPEAGPCGFEWEIVS